MYLHSLSYLDTVLMRAIQMLPPGTHAITYRQTSDISRTVVGNKIVDHSVEGGRWSNWIFIPDLTPGFNGLGRDNCKMSRETFTFCDLVRLTLEIWQYHDCCCPSDALCQCHTAMAPVPLSKFRSNSKFDENSKHFSVKCTRPITTIFCTRHDSVTVVTCAKYCCGRSSIFETREFWIFIKFRIRSKYT